MLPRTGFGDGAGNAAPATPTPAAGKTELTGAEMIEEVHAAALPVDLPAPPPVPVEPSIPPPPRPPPAAVTPLTKARVMQLVKGYEDTSLDDTMVDGETQESEERWQGQRKKRHPNDGIPPPAKARPCRTAVPPVAASSAAAGFPDLDPEEQDLQDQIRQQQLLIQQQMAFLSQQSEVLTQQISAYEVRKRAKLQLTAKAPPAAPAAPLAKADSQASMSQQPHGQELLLQRLRQEIPPEQDLQGKQTLQGQKSLQEKLAALHQQQLQQQQITQSPHQQMTQSPHQQITQSQQQQTTQAADHAVTAAAKRAVTTGAATTGADAAAAVHTADRDHAHDAGHKSSKPAWPLPPQHGVGTG